MKNLARLIVVLIHVLCAISTQAQTAPEQARNFQINTTHTGSISVPGLTPPLQEKWRRDFGRVTSYPIIADGRVFVSVASQFSTGLGSIMFALDQNTGATLWVVGISSRFPWSALCYENGRVFALSAEGVLRAYDAATGNLIWQRLFPFGNFSAPPTVHQGVIYISGYDGAGSVHAVSTVTGEVLWRVGLIGDNSAPAVTSEGLYISFSCLNVFKLNPANGSQIWKYNTGCSGGFGTPPVLYNGNLYVSDFTDTVFDSQTGAITGGFTARGLPVFSGNLGFFLNSPGFTYGTVEARDLATNNVVWSFAGDGYLQSSLLVVNDYVYVGSAQGRLYALNMTTGEEVWSNTAGASIPFNDDHDLSHPTTGFAAAEGLLVIPTSTSLVAYERDQTPPTVTWGVPSPAANASGWYNSPVDFPFTPSDSGSGVASSLPESPLHFTVEGANQTQQVTLTDRLGNTGTVTSPPLNIDLSAPVSSVVISGPQANGEWYGPGAAQISLSATDSLSGVKDTFYSINDGAAFPYVTPFSLFPDGTKTVSFWSTDRAGNTEAPQSRIVKVDAIAPTTQASVPGIQPAGWYYNPAQVTLTASDSGSGVGRTNFIVDGGPEQTYTGPFNVSGDGTHQVTYWSIDAVGNVEVHRSFTILVDANAPSTQFSISGTVGTNGWYRSAVQVSLAASDTVSGVQTTFYKVDGGTTKTYLGTAFNVSGNGSHTVNHWSVDKAGNTEAMRALTIRIDTNLPNVSANATPGSVSQGPNPVIVTVSGRVTDNTSGVLTSSVTFSVVDEYGVTQPSGPVVLQANGTYSFTLSLPATRNTGDASHVYTITVRAVDQAGNVDTHSDTVKITS